jgi:raffinose/stachyose/melibiose transport system substrate-binding protein
MEITVDPKTTSRRNFLGLAAGAPLAAALAACGSSGPAESGSGGGGGGGKTANTSYWFITGKPGEQIRTATVERFNKANPTTKIKIGTFANDPYKAKIKTAIGSGKAPTIIWGWGGGTLRAFAEAGQVDDLTSWFESEPELKKRLFPASFGPATIDGKIYAMPAETVEPLVLFYNKKKFAEVNAEAPKTWAELMALVPKFKAKGIAPISLAGQSKWTNMMWLEMMYDRIGGTEVFDAIFAGEKDAWSHPASIEALTKIQELVKAGGFQKGFASTTADSNADQALLHTGRAAMMLHGTWTYGSMEAEGGKFVSGGDLGYVPFPTVEGGKGDPSAAYGNAGQYLSISSKATAEQKDIAKKFFKTAILDDTEIKQWIDTGGVPIVNGTQSALASSKSAEFLDFVYGIASKAKSFGQSWDQALSPTAAEELLDNIAELFQLSITPQEYANKMNAVLGK